MGAWGAGLKQNDNFLDIFDEFIDFYNEGYSVTDITNHLIEEHQDLIKSKEYSDDFWFAIAYCQWDCKELDKSVFETVEQIISSRKNIKLWEENNASSDTLKKRELALANFLEKLKTEKAKARRRVKKKYYDSIFNAGDCLTYILTNGNYGGAFVLTDEKETEYPKNFIAIVNIDKPQKPNINDFIESYVLFEKYEHPLLKRPDGGPLIGYFTQYDYKLIDFEIEVIGNLVTNDKYNPGNTYKGFSWKTLRLNPDSDLYPNWSVVDNKTIPIRQWIK
jgi:hypothetical protein